MKIIKQEIQFEESLKQRLEFICEFSFDIIDSEENGLSIGAMTSQVLAIFYLNDMDYFIKETLNISHFLKY